MRACLSTRILIPMAIYQLGDLGPETFTNLFGGGGRVFDCVMQQRRHQDYQFWKSAVQWMARTAGVSQNAFFASAVA